VGKASGKPAAAAAAAAPAPKFVTSESGMPFFDDFD